MLRLFRLKKSGTPRLSKKKIVAISVMGLMLGTSSISYGWGWHSIIRPGSHVFDAKRFADSTRETLQMIEVQVQKMEEFRARVEEFKSLSTSAINETHKTLSMAKKAVSLHNLGNIKNEDAILKGAAYYGVDLDSYHNTVRNLDKRMSTANKDTVKNLNALNAENEKIEKQVATVMGTSEDGLKSEEQKRVMLKALQATTTANTALIEANDAKREMLSMESDRQREEAASKLNTTLSYSSYDPYDKNTWGDKVKKGEEPKTYTTLPGLDDDWDKDGK